MAPQLQAALAGVKLGEPDSANGKLDGILSNPNLFGVSRMDAGLDGIVTDYFKELIAGPGAVRATLKKHLD